MMSHGACWLWYPPLVTLHALSDAIIFVAYAALPLLMLVLARKIQGRKATRLPAILFPELLALWALFILCCGMTHLLEAITVFVPWFWLSGCVKAATAVVSISALFATWRRRRSIIGLGQALLAADLARRESDP